MLHWILPSCLDPSTVLLTFQIFDFFFSLYMILNYWLYQETSLQNFFPKDNYKKALLIYSNQEYYCRLFWKVCFCICPLNFIQTSKSVLIIGTMHMSTCANNYWKCVNSNVLHVIMLLYTSASTMRCLFNVVADCRVQLYQKEVFVANFFNKYCYQWNNKNLLWKTSHNLFSKTLYQSSKVSPYSLFGTSAGM